MRKLSLLLLLSAVLAGSALADAAVAPNDGRSLLRVASTLSGLKIRKTVPLVREPLSRFKQRRSAMAAGFYTPKLRAYDETLYRAFGLTAGRGTLQAALATGDRRPAVYDSRVRRIFTPRLARMDRRGVIEAYVSALQDQHFDTIRRARTAAKSRDAAFGAWGAVAGHSTLIGARLNPATRRTQATMPRLARFLALQQAFPGTVGLRLAADLRNLGGNQAVFTALRRFPATTEQVFHLDKFLERERAIPIVLPVDAAGLTLSGDDTFGELDVRALLASFGVAAVDRAGTGWGGGRSAVYRAAGREAVLIALDWDSEEDAAQWQVAVSNYVPRAFPASRAGDCDADGCWAADGTAAAFTIDGVRTALVLGADLESSATLARAALGR